MFIIKSKRKYRSTQNPKLRMKSVFLLSVKTVFITVFTDSKNSNEYSFQVCFTNNLQLKIISL